MTTFEQTTLPHPADILEEEGYAPLDNLVELNRPNKAFTSHEADIIVRWFPYDAQSVSSLRQHGSNSVPALESLLVVQEAEYARLATHGIAIARHRSAVLPYNPTLGATVPSIITVVERLAGKPLHQGDPRGHMLPAQYARYATDDVDTRHTLVDIQRPEQHLIADGIDARPVLHDLEPRLNRIEEAGNLIYDRRFASWAEQMRNPESRAILASELGKLGMPFFTA